MENEVGTLLKQSGFAFKKRLGQNFITDRNLLAAIVRDAGVSRCDEVVEIGCGAGTLTRELAAAAKHVTAFEVDQSLKPVLGSTLDGVDNVDVIFADFMKTDLTALESKIGEFSVAANIPYYVTTPLITKILDESRMCRSITVMVQEEVAERLAARENTPEYGAITAVIALRASARILRRVPKEMFTPRPKVDSAVVKLSVEDGRLSVADPEMYKKTVRAAFSSRRKTLENNLVNFFGITRSQARAALENCGENPMARGETLSPERFAALSDALSVYVKK